MGCSKLEAWNTPGVVTECVMLLVSGRAPTLLPNHDPERFMLGLLTRMDSAMLARSSRECSCPWIIWCICCWVADSILGGGTMQFLASIGGAVRSTKGFIGERGSSPAASRGSMQGFTCCLSCVGHGCGCALACFGDDSAASSEYASPVL